MMLGTLSSVSSLGSVPENRVDSDSLLGLSEVKGHHHRHLWVGGLVGGGVFPVPRDCRVKPLQGVCVLSALPPRAFHPSAA